jgi:predicted homoserine dehydrogenase-like protein
MADVQHEYRVGLVGFGGRGAGLVRFWQVVPGAHLVAIADLIPELLDKARGSFGDMACYPDHQRASGMMTVPLADGR